MCTSKDDNGEEMTQEQLMEFFDSEVCNKIVVIFLCILIWILRNII